MKAWASFHLWAGLVLACIPGVACAAEPPCAIADIAWTLGPDHPEPRKGGCLTAINGKVISVFGMRYPWGEMATMYIYDPLTASWSQGPDGPIGQTYLEGTECGNLFYALGGRSASEGGVHPLCFALGASNYSWTQIASLNQARAFAPSASCGQQTVHFRGGHEHDRTDHQQRGDVRHVTDGCYLANHLDFAGGFSRLG